MGSFSRFIVPLASIVVGGIIILATGGAATPAATALWSKVGVGLLISGGLGLVTGLITAPGGQSLGSSPNYSFANVSNHRGEGEPIPLVYGEVEYAPLAISTTVDMSKDADVDIIERVYLLGWGPMEVYDSTGILPGSKDEQREILERVKINGLRILDLDPDASCEYLSQTTASVKRLKGYNRIGRPFPQSPTQLGKDDVFLYTMKDDADGVHITFDWPSGLYRIDSDGDVAVTAAGVKFQFRVADSGAAWQDMKIGGTVEDTRTVIQKLLYPNPIYKNVKSDVNPNWLLTWAFVRTPVDGEYYVHGNTRGFKREIVKFTFEDRGRYEIRLTGLYNNVDSVVEPTVTRVTEIDNGDVTTVEGVSLLGVRFRSNEQTRGSEPILKIKARGLKIEKLETAGRPTGWTNNGVSIAYDFLAKRNVVLGLWLDEDDDFDAGAGGTWETEAIAIESETFSITPDKGGAKLTGTLGRCSLIIDTQAAARDWLNHILATFRGSVYEVEGQFRLMREKTVSSVRTFEARPGQAGRYNVLSDQGGRPILDVTDLDANERYNRVVLRYVDADRDFVQRTITKIESAAVGVTIPERTLDIFLPGIASEGQALHEATYILAKARDSTTLIRWGVAWGDLDLVPGDRVTVNIEYPQWAGDTKDFWVLGLEYGLDGVGYIVGREYVDVGSEDPETTEPTDPPKQPTTPPIGTTDESTGNPPPKDPVNKPKPTPPGQTNKPKGKAKGFLFKVIKKIKGKFKK